ncbi:hypothetical protein G0U57_000993 [Chelydra serpentina]|uniref:Uncharacterized protein n=1 Tax=Chelydra serpentina TaxID=8475 RepID=A0A8T1S1G7_CHESE|nr:hypothetical protein G0U57_000993 [Chelydra serpentina]
MTERHAQSSVLGGNAELRAIGSHFLTPSSLGKVEPKSLREYADIISHLHKQFDVWFKDFKALEPHLNYSSHHLPGELTCCRGNAMELWPLQMIHLKQK